MTDKILHYKTIEQAGTSLFKDRNSKFLGFAIPIAVLSEVKIHLQQLKAAHPKAGHFCFAYRLGFDKSLFRSSDDGEPAGSAGKPLLGQIDSHGLTNILLVVVRYFGGTLLGVPGLINAYKAAGSEAIINCKIVEKPITNFYQLEFEYPILSEIYYQLEANQAKVTEQELTLFCVLKIAVPLEFESKLITWLSTVKNLKMEKI